MTLPTNPKQWSRREPETWYACCRNPRVAAQALSLVGRSEGAGIDLQEALKLAPLPHHPGPHKTRTQSTFTDGSTVDEVDRQAAE